MSAPGRAMVRMTTGAVVCPDGLAMAADVFSPGDRELGGLPITVFCHGFKGFRRWGMFPHVAERLAESGRAVVLFDLSHNGVDGTGATPEAFTRLELFKQQTVSRHVDDLGCVIDALGDGLGLATQRASVVGHSMGGGVGVLRAAIDERVESLCLLNSVSHYERIGPDGLAELEASGQVSIPNARTGQVMPLGRPWFDDLPRHDLEAAGACVTVPTLVLQGSDDTNVTPDEGAALAEWISEARLVTVPGGDHTFGARHPWAGWTDPLERVVAELDAFLPKAGP